MKPLDERLAAIQLNTDACRTEAEGIYAGINDGYDGADGARTVIGLCDDIDDLLAIIQSKL